MKDFKKTILIMSIVFISLICISAVSAASDDGAALAVDDSIYDAPAIAEVSEDVETNVEDNSGFDDLETSSADDQVLGDDSPVYDAQWGKESYDNNNTGQSPYNGPKTNATLWDYSVDGSGFTAPVVDSSGRVYVGTSSKIYILNPDGTSNGTINLGWGSNPHLLITGNYLYYPQDGNALIIYDLTTLSNVNVNNWYASSGWGAQLDKEGNIYVFDKYAGLTKDPFQDYPMWTTSVDDTGVPHDGSGYGISNVGIVNGVMYVDTGLVLIPTIESIKVLSADDGSFITSLNGVTYPVISNGVIYSMKDDILFGTQISDYISLYEINIPSGQGKVLAADSEGTIYVANAAGDLFKYVPGEEAMSLFYSVGSTLTAAPVIGADGIVYISTDDGDIMAVSKDGEKIWSYSTGSAITRSPAMAADGTLYVVNSAGELYAFNIPIKDADGNIVVTADNFDILFDENGNFIYETEAGSTVLIDALTDKNMVFNQKLNIGAKEGSGVITNGTITLAADAAGSVIDGLTFDYTGASNLITLADGISDVTVSNNIIKLNSTGHYAAAIAAGNWGYGPISNMKIVSNKIDVICENAAAYAIDVAGGWGQKTVTDSIISLNNITIQANGMAEAIYVCSASNFNITDNNIAATSEAGGSYGIAADNSDNIGITGNTIDSTSKQAAYGIANTHNDANTISDNKITVEGASAIGVGVGFDTGSVIEGNTIDVNASDDYASTPTSDSALGTGNSGIKLTNNATATISNNFVSSNGAQMDLDGASADTNVGTNYVAMEGNPDEKLNPVVVKPSATSVSVASATVTADPNGASKTRNIAITVKDANGNVVADQTIKVYVNGALKTAKTNANGVATLAVAYKAAGTTVLVASFDGADNLLGNSATGKLTVKKNAVKMAAKTKKVKKSQASKAKVKFTLKVGKTALKKKLVTIKINKKTYKAKTNAKGIVTFKVKLPKKAKKYSYTVKFAGDKFCNAKTLKGKLTVK